MLITRLAPSPTGALHLGNARTFLATWLLARQRGWQIVLRIEDLDGPRIRHEAAAEAIADLKWLGLDWDAGPEYQSRHLDRYRTAIDRLVADGYAYPCVCTRSEIEQAVSAPHADDGASVYPGTCRGRFNSIFDAMEKSGRKPALRFAMPEMSFEYRDDFAGVRRFDLAKQLGDFVLAKPDGTPSYQLAVVVDDIAAGVTHVVRGDDLIDSVPRQVLLYQALGAEDRMPNYTHLPLVLGTDGKRLAKRHGDTRIGHYRDRGVSPSRMRALLAKWLGLGSHEERSIDQLLGSFDLAKISHEPIKFAEVDDLFLLAGGG